MKQTEPQDSTDTLAQRFRSERERLNLMTANIAHFCGVSVSSVFAWEAGRSRIPLSAAASLWEHGFDVEVIVAGSVKMEAVPILSESENYSDASAEYLVPSYILSRSGVTARTAFVYHNRFFFQDIASSGDLLLMAWLAEGDEQEILREDRIFLFRPKATDMLEFLCKIRKARNGRLKIEVNGVSKTVSVKTMFRLGCPIGQHCYRVGNRKVEGNVLESHDQRLALFLKSLGTNSK